MSLPNVMYCTASVQLGGSGQPVVAFSGFVMRPDGTTLPFGPEDEFTSFADLEIPLAYGMSLLSLKNQILPAVQRGYSAPDLQAEVVIVPLFW